MKINTFIFDQTGNCDYYEPDILNNNNLTSDFMKHQSIVLKNKGASVCLSQYVTLDALISLQQIIQSELTIRAEIESNSNN